MLTHILGVTTYLSLEVVARVVFPDGRLAPRGCDVAGRGLIDKVVQSWKEVMMKHCLDQEIGLEPYRVKILRS